MISINLLPGELRKAERTPLIVFLPLIAGLVVVLSAGAFAGYVKFSWLAEVNNERVASEQTLAEKKPRLNYSTALLKEEAEFKKQTETIVNIASGRILMTRKLDELCQLMAEGDAGEHGGFKVWLKEMKTKPAAQKRGRGKKGAVNGGEMSFKGYALADRAPLQDFNRLHRALKDSGFYRDGYVGLSDPDGSVQAFGDDLSPKKGWSFDLKALFRDPSERFKERKKARLLQAKRSANKKESR